MKFCPVCYEFCKDSDELHLHLINKHHWSIERIEGELGEMRMGKTHTARLLNEGK